MKQIVKSILPQSALNSALKLRDWLRFVALSQKNFNSDHLCTTNTFSLSDIYADTGIASGWEEDCKVISAIYGDDDNLGGVNPGDRRALYYLVMGLKPENVLEVGTHIGASTLHIARALKRLNNNGKVTSADIMDVNHPQTGAWKQLGLPKSPQDFAEDLECNQHIKFHIGPCLDFMAQTTQRYDLIFLDGDHSAQSVYQEVSASLPLLKENGVILLHDFYPRASPLYPDNVVISGPFKALDRIRKEKPEIGVLPLGSLPWPTKQGTSVTSLALVVKQEKI